MLQRKVPGRYTGVLSCIAELTDDGYEALLAEVAALHEPVNFRHFAERVSKEAAIGEAEASQIIELLYSIGRTVEEGGHNLRIWIEGLAGASELEIGEADRGRFCDRMGALLGGAPMNLLYEFMVLRYGHERMFGDAHLALDIRPMLPEDPSMRSVALIMHSLHIAFWRSGHQEDFYVTMTRADLHSLRSLIDRAITSEEAIESSVTVTGNMELVPMGDWR